MAILSIKSPGEQSAKQDAAFLQDFPEDLQEARQRVVSLKEEFNNLPLKPVNEEDADSTTDPLADRLLEAGGFDEIYREDIVRWVEDRARTTVESDYPDYTRHYTYAQTAIEQSGYVIDPQAWYTQLLEKTEQAKTQGSDSAQQVEQARTQVIADLKRGCENLSDLLSREIASMNRIKKAALDRLKGDTVKDAMGDREVEWDTTLAALKLDLNLPGEEQA